MKFSTFADKLAGPSGINLLMNDLTDGLRPERNMLMLGGGNPARIPSIRRFFREHLQNLLANGTVFDQAVGNYDPPQGNPEFTAALAALLNDQFGWPVTGANIALTNGSQQAFFLLFNMFAGTFADGSHKKILFPMAPEYIGYSDVGLKNGLFESALPSIEVQDALFFKYHINFDALNVSDEIGAICVSRPTNPTGNVLTDEEITKLAAIANEKDIPLIIDNAYGTPFPNIIYTDVTPYWDHNTIVCMSLSKFGMPGTRTGIIIADEAIIERISRINAVISLAPGGIGTALATELVKTGQILSLSKDTIAPFYREKMEIAVELAQKHFAGLDVALHRPEGSFFLWAWFKKLPITSHQLYQQLKDSGVIVVPGHYFFFGLNEPHPHADQCIRINYAQEKEAVETAFKIIAEQVRQCRKLVKENSPTEKKNKASVHL